MIRPLTLVAVCYAVGIVAGRVLEPSPGLCLWAGFGLLLAAAMAERIRSSSMWLLFGLLGATSFALDDQPLAGSDLRRRFSGEARIVSLRGTVCGPPTLRLWELDGETTERSMAEVEVAAVREGTEWRPASGRIVASIGANLEGRCFAGQAVELVGVLAAPPGPKAPGLFDYRAFLANQGIHFLLRLDRESDWRLAPDNRVAGPGFSERFVAWARANLARGLPDDDATALLWGMVLGWKTGLTDEVSEPFMRSGTLHIFAISGLHIALIAAILVKLAVMARVPRRWCLVPVAGLIWFYVAATGWQASAVRSAVMMTVILLGWALNRPPDLLNSLFVAALCLLVWSPHQLFQASFQLSFSVVLAIALFGAAFETRFRRWLEPDEFLARDLRNRWQRGRDWMVRWVVKGLSVSAAAWIGSLPLTAHYFHLLTPGSLLANVVIVPLSGVALAGAVASLACGAWAQGLAEVFNHAAWVSMQAMVHGSAWFAEWPGASWYVPSPAGWEMALFGLGAGALGWGRFRAGLLRRIAGSAFVALGLSLAIRAGLDVGLTRLTVLPLEGGQVIHVDAAGRSRDLLVDTGDQAPARLVLQPFLRAQGVNRLPRLWLTHGDVRHVGGAADMVTAFGIGEVGLGPLSFRSPVYRREVFEIETALAEVATLESGDRVAGWTVLHPAPKDRFSQADDGALVLQGDIHGIRWLLLSDLGGAGQESILERWGDALSADVVILGLPTLGEPLRGALLERIRPRLILVADAERPASERASASLRERLGREPCPVWFTRTEGVVTAEISRGGQCQLRSMSGRTLRLEARSVR